MAVSPVALRAATALWIAGVVLLAAAVGLGGRVAQAHLSARKAWLEASERIGEPGYDAERSDALYAGSEEALDSLRLWTRVGGAGLLALVSGLLLRRRLRTPPRSSTRGRSLLRIALALGAGGLAFYAVTAATAAPSHALLGPALAAAGEAAAPFVAATAAAVPWLSRSAR